MLNFLRKLRRNNMNSKYLKYAIGEIVLVVIGILIALAISNWNEQRKDNDYLHTLLQEMDISLSQDSLIVQRIYLQRNKDKEEGVNRLLKAVNEKPKISNDSILSLLELVMNDYYYTYDDGAYEALKIYGLDKIKDRELRTLLIVSYERRIPTFQTFANETNDQWNLLSQTLEKEFIAFEASKKEGNYDLERKIKVSDILENDSFLRWLDIENNKMKNQRSRLTSLIDFNSQIRIKVREYLNK